MEIERKEYRQVVGWTQHGVRIQSKECRQNERLGRSVRYSGMGWESRAISATIHEVLFLFQRLHKALLQTSTAILLCATSFPQRGNNDLLKTEGAKTEDFIHTKQSFLVAKVMLYLL